MYVLLFVLKFYRTIPAIGCEAFRWKHNLQSMLFVHYCFITYNRYSLFDARCGKHTKFRHDLSLIILIRPLSMLRLTLAPLLLDYR